MAPLGDDLGGWDSHHYRLHSGGLHHAGLRWSLLHRGQPKHGGPARLPSQQQLHGLSERCECSLTSVPAEDWKYYPMRSLDCTTPFYKHVVHVENSYRLSCCRIFEGETFTWEATLCRALCIYRFLRESLWELIYIKKTDASQCVHSWNTAWAQFSSVSSSTFLRLFLSVLYLSH